MLVPFFQDEIKILEIFADDQDLESEHSLIGGERRSEYRNHSRHV
jgi:hypothetical protein